MRSDGSVVGIPDVRLTRPLRAGALERFRATADEGYEAGARLRAAVHRADLGVTASIDVAVPPEGEADTALLARAERALYRVKGAGRDGVAVADDEPLPVAPPL